MNVLFFLNARTPEVLRCNLVQNMHCYIARNIFLKDLFSSYGREKDTNDSRNYTCHRRLTMVLALTQPFGYPDISNTPYLVLTTGHFTNTIFTHQKHTHMETQTFNFVAYQCLDFSSIIPKGKMTMCICINTVTIKLDWKSTGPSKHASVWAGMYRSQYTAPGQMRSLVDQKCSRETKNKKPSVVQLPLPPWLPGAAQGPQQHFGGSW